jgi:hypothetical protein
MFVHIDKSILKSVELRNVISVAFSYPNFTRPLLLLLSTAVAFADGATAATVLPVGLETAFCTDDGAADAAEAVAETR